MLLQQKEGKEYHGKCLMSFDDLWNYDNVNSIVWTYAND